MPTYFQITGNSWGKFPGEDGWAGASRAVIFGIDLRQVTNEYNDKDLYGGFGRNLYSSTWSKAIYTYCKKENNTFYYYAWNNGEEPVTDIIDCSENQCNAKDIIYNWIAF